MRRRAARGSRPLLRRRSLALLGVVCLLASACGGSAGPDRPPPEGTLTLANRTDTSQSPLSITSFFVQPTGSEQSADDLLTQPLIPGAIVIVGLFPEGTYDALALLENGFGIPFLDVQIVGEQPTTLVVSFPDDP